MGSKIATIISLLFVVIFIILGADIMSIQYIYSDLDSKSVNISYIISKNGMNDNVISYIEDKYEITFTCLSNCQAEVGDIIDFKISKEYDPIILSSDNLTIFVKRQAVIGYYG